LFWRGSFVVVVVVVVVVVESEFSTIRNAG